MATELLFAKFAPKTLEPINSIGNKFIRLLQELNLAGSVSGKNVAIKMHLGGGGGFSTIHPFFVRKLVQEVKTAGARSVFVTDLYRDTIDAVDRGYTEEVFGCPIVPICNEKDDNFRTFPVEPAFKGMDHIEISEPLLAADVLLDFSHVKGHGACGFGGASKNLSMGAVTNKMRQILHSLEGGLHWDADKCIRCGVCIDNCPNHAMSFKEDVMDIFYHDCRFCQHCVMICPEGAIKMTAGGYEDFQRGMAMTTAKVLENFAPERRIFINMLMDTTIYCDCWGMTTPRLIPDIGILAGRDIVAIEEASLELIDKEELIPGALPEGWNFKENGTHLFDRIHGKDPYAVIRFLEELGCGERSYTLREIE